MGTPTAPQPVKVIASIIYQKDEFFFAAVESMISRWKAIDFLSERLAFSYTDYYEREMGKGLWRRIISFEILRDPAELWEIKHSTNHLEASISKDFPEHRAVNIDPGYVNAYHLILATTKPSPHRPYLQQGIYADLTLMFREKKFRVLPWTYPDYESETMIAIVHAVRKKYLFQRKRPDQVAHSMENSYLCEA